MVFSKFANVDASLSFDLHGLGAGSTLVVVRS